jgi:hypothetical protein
MMPWLNGINGRIGDPPDITEGIYETMTFLTIFIHQRKFDVIYTYYHL